ncbi:hypothetical protein BOX15_Mlig024683g1 [Macrostomum lignano]|uniref:Translationally-controlled tumor protein homolog n=1 Tax=Macrostomum lignano TaxID=282301 RepID=A0A267EZB4_9PLAT|nr:hypothetical protein BOX15_Mlig024683g1 [Macrostomum lignano]
MLIFKDLISGDELASDSYPYKYVDDIAIEIEGKMITVSNAIDDRMIGGNASAEEAGEGTDDGTESKINVVYSHQLVETQFDKKSYLAYLKGYLKRIEKKLEENNPDRVEAFKTGAQKFVKERVLANFSNWQFFTGEKMDPDAMVVLMDYREDGMTPYFVLFKDGLIEEKCCSAYSTGIVGMEHPKQPAMFCRN